MSATQCDTCTKMLSVALSVAKTLVSLLSPYVSHVIPAAPEIPSLPKCLPSLILRRDLLLTWPEGMGYIAGMVASS